MRRAANFGARRLLRKRRRCISLSDLVTHFFPNEVLPKFHIFIGQTFVLTFWLAPTD
jgi:hypothetical protein